MKPKGKPFATTEKLLTNQNLCIPFQLRAVHVHPEAVVIIPN